MSTNKLLYHITQTRSWIYLQNRVSDEYIEGVDKFLDYAYENSSSSYESRIFCSCKKYTNRYLVEKTIPREHIIIHGFLKKYKTWSFHGESYHSQNYSGECSINHHVNLSDDMIRMIHEAAGIPAIDVSLHENPHTSNNPIDDFTVGDEKLRKLI
ncbi:hypothetical protein KSP39_PZI015964 [Platanthera zijinensis]|uniref:Transposase-associated domain-containing protein n=1 Tax=Platanthera zijinensis TaxID=2320716 RepID=A0AAP0B9W7_9ASPA